MNEKPNMTDREILEATVEPRSEMSKAIVMGTKLNAAMNIGVESSPMAVAFILRAASDLVGEMEEAPTDAEIAAQGLSDENLEHDRRLMEGFEGLQGEIDSALNSLFDRIISSKDRMRTCPCESCREHFAAEAAQNN